MKRELAASPSRVFKLGVIFLSEPSLCEVRQCVLRIWLSVL